MKRFLVVLLALVAVGSLAANALLFQRYSTRRPIIRVGSEAISKKEYEDAIDYQYPYGKQVLTKMVLTRVVRQAAQKAGVMPTEKDIDTRIVEIERRGPQLLAEAKSDPAKMRQFRDDMLTEMALEKLRIKDVKVTDAEVAAAYNRNRAGFALPEQRDTLIVIADNTVDAQTAANLLKQKMDPDVIARQPRLKVVGVRGFSVNWQRVPQALTARMSQAVSSLTAGQVTTVPLGNQFAVIRVNSVRKAAAPSLGAAKEKAAQIARLEKAPQPNVMLARLYKAAGVQIENSRYAPFFSGIEAMAGEQAGTAADAGKSVSPP